MLTARTRAADRGSALVMAIVFVTVIGLVVTIALGYSAVSLRASAKHYVPTRDRLYASDAAVKAAIQTVVASPAEGRSGSGCKASKSFGSVHGEPVTVQVCPQGANSLLLTTGTGAANFGLKALAVTTEPGIVVSGKAGMKVNGNVESTSSISVGNNSVLAVIGGTVKATGGGCSVGSVTVDGVGVANCTVAPTAPVDPGFVLTGVTTAPAAASGSCNTTTKVASLQPGTWTQSTFDTAIGSCNYVYLAPGLHYLQDVTWSIKNKVIAGTLPNGTAGMATSAFGAGCVKTSPGATLALGGSSTISFSGSSPSLEVCGASYAQSGGAVKLPLFGIPNDIGTTVTSPFVKGPVAAPTGTTGWTNLPNALLLGDSLSATSTSFKSTTSPVPALTFTIGLSSDPVLSTATSLTAVVSASSTVTSGTSLTVDVTDSSTTPKTCTTPTKQTVNNNTLKSYTFTITCPAGLKAPFTAKVTTSTTSTTARTASVDGMTLSYAVVPATKMAAQSGSLITPNGSAVISSSGNGNGMWFDGVIYMPKAKIAVQIPASSLALSTLGIVVRVLDVQTTGSTQNQPVVATDNITSTLSAGDVTVQALVNGIVWMTCRVTFATAGTAVTGFTTQACTIPH
ncbi:MAG: hypothetical protein RJA49_1209 [Actinomycetota bacterium]